MVDSLLNRWKLDPESNVPLHLQLSEFIRWSITSGELSPGSQLPPIRELAERLGISLNTVKAAYRSLRESDLLVTRRGRGTSVVAPDLFLAPRPETPEQILEQAIRAGLDAGYSLERMEKAAKQVLSRLQTDRKQLAILLVECDRDVLDLLGQDLRSYLGLTVEKALLSQLDRERFRLLQRPEKYAAIATTYFHYREVKEALGGLGLPILGLGLATSAETLAQLSHLPPGSVAGAVCRDAESQTTFASLVQTIVGADALVRVCLLEDEAGLADLIAQAQVLVTTVPCRRALMAKAPGKPVHTLYDRVDPSSLNILARHLAPWTRSRSSLKERFPKDEWQPAESLPEPAHLA